jgi:hypothetical protein
MIASGKSAQRLSVVVLLVLAAMPPVSAASNPGALVLVNSQAAEYTDFQDFLEPYLSQFGVPYAVWDIARQRLQADIGNYALLIIAHRGLDVTHRFLSPNDEQRLLIAIETGTGLVSFDGLAAGWSGGKPQPLYRLMQEIFGLTFVKAEQATAITIAASAVAPGIVPVGHYITRSDSVPRTVTLKRPMTVPGMLAGPHALPLAYVGNQPMLVSATYGRGRAVLCTTYDWTKPDLKGKLYGLDDLVWRSLVWAARKPFLLRGMPHYLALRIDDVSGFGLGSNRHLGYVATANRYGLKPWLGIFMDDLREDPEAIQALAHFTQQGLATASVHARRWHEFFYLEEPLWNDEWGTNIAARDLSADQVAANFAQAEDFFARHGILKSKLVLPHFYEFGTNVFEGLQRWGAQFVGTVLEPGRGYGTPLLRAEPYLVQEPPHPSNGSNPIFIADWLAVPGHPEFNHRFFNFVEEVRDVTGYEWAPSHVSVEEAIRRGVVECRREFDSLLPAVLFTHESDHIQHLQPEEWDHILAGVMQNLEAYQPVSVTLDFLAQYLRTLRTSKIISANYNTTTREGTLELEGMADLPTKFYVFESSRDNSTAREWEAPAFQGKIVVPWRGEPGE